jgi:hypothetical protein
MALAAKEHPAPGRPVRRGPGRGRAWARALTRGWDRGRGRGSRSGMLDELRQSPLFSGATDRQLRSVARSAEVAVVPADYRLTRQGDRVQEFLVVVSGRLAVTAGAKLVRVVGPGTWLGAVPILRQSRSQVSVTALTPARVICLGVREFNAFADAVPGFAARLLADIARGAMTPLDSALDVPDGPPIDSLDGWAGAGSGRRTDTETGTEADRRCG